MRLLQGVGVLYVTCCLALLGHRLLARPAGGVPPVSVRHDAPRSQPRTSASEWYERVKPNCNALEIETRMASDPPPDDRDGMGYGAACFALAGKLDRARNLVAQLPAADRSAAANVVFAIGHAVADTGDEKSAAPLLRLVLDFTPDNPLALYHVGMAEASTDAVAARKHLRRFLETHTLQDSTRTSAEAVISRLERGRG